MEEDIEKYDDQQSQTQLTSKLSASAFVPN